MAKITKGKLIELIQESLGEYMDDSPEGMAGDSMAMEPESPCAMAAAAEEEEEEKPRKVAATPKKTRGPKKKAVASNET